MRSKAHTRASSAGDGAPRFIRVHAPVCRPRRYADRALPEPEAAPAADTRPRYMPLTATEVEAATSASKLLTSRDVLRQTLELASKSGRKEFAEDAQRVLNYLDMEDENEEEARDGLGRGPSSPNRSTVSGRRRADDALFEIGGSIGNNVIDAVTIQSHLQARSDAEAAGQTVGGGAPGVGNPGAISVSLRSERLKSCWDPIKAVLPRSQDFDILLSFAQYTSLTNVLVFAFVQRYPTLGLEFELPGALVAYQERLGWLNIFNMDLQTVADWATAFRYAPRRRAPPPNARPGGQPP